MHAKSPVHSLYNAHMQDAHTQTQTHSPFKAETLGASSLGGVVSLETPHADGKKRGYPELRWFDGE